jgi:hypothetical protein
VDWKNLVHSLKINILYLSTFIQDVVAVNAENDHENDSSSRTLDAMAIKVVFNNDTTDSTTATATTTTTATNTTTTTTTTTTENGTTGGSTKKKKQTQVVQQQQQKCGILPNFDEYGCTCYGDPSKCPSDCIGGQIPIETKHIIVSVVMVYQIQVLYQII